VFGIGAGLTIDEFALWVYLDDVYWAKEGRSSIDAMVLAGGAMLLVLLGVRPFDIAGSPAAVVAVAAILLALVLVCFAKQRVLHGALGMFVWPVAAYGAARLGKPASPWAKRFYGARNPGKQAKAVRRFRLDRRTQRSKERFRDAIGGRTTEVREAQRMAHGATREAAEEIRQRADRLAVATTEAERARRRGGP
jgi:lysyl-tRNA synthetase class 2